MNFLDRLLKIAQISNSLKPRLVEAESFHTDGHDKYGGRFSTF
jgi:hypothetical protein